MYRLVPRSRTPLALGLSVIAFTGAGGDTARIHTGRTAAAAHATIAPFDNSGALSHVECADDPTCSAPSGCFRVDGRAGRVPRTPWDRRPAS